METNKTPQFACPNASNDLFTLKTGTKGNKALTNPIGLITADEVAYAGGVNSTTNSTYYLYTGSDYWIISPQLFQNLAYEYTVSSNGNLFGSSLNNRDFGVRPVINLKSTVEIEEGGIGTASNPYVIKYNMG